MDAVGVRTVVDGIVFGSMSWLLGTALDWVSIVVGLDSLVLLFLPLPLLSSGSIEVETASGIDVGVGVLVPPSVSVGRVGFVGF